MGIIIWILILRPLTGGGLSIRGLHYLDSVGVLMSAKVGVGGSISWWRLGARASGGEKSACEESLFKNSAVCEQWA